HPLHRRGVPRRHGAAVPGQPLRRAGRSLRRPRFRHHGSVCYDLIGSIRLAPRGGRGLTQRVVRLLLLLGVAQAGCAGVAPPAPTPQGHAQVYLDRGQALIARGEMAAAVSALREALRREPDLIQARTSLGLALYGLGERDAEATPEFLVAAQAGHARAQYFTGTAYAAGLGVERDLTTAITWWFLAAEQGVTQADEALAQLRQVALGRGRRAAADRATVEQAFRDYRAALWRDFPGLAANGDDTVGGALLR